MDIKDGRLVTGHEYSSLKKGKATRHPSPSASDLTWTVTPSQQVKDEKKNRLDHVYGQLAP